jgi:hypothetical protein
MFSLYAQFILYDSTVNICRPQRRQAVETMSLMQINDIFLCDIMNKDLLLYVGVIAELDRLQINQGSNANVQNPCQLNLTTSSNSQ